MTRRSVASLVLCLSPLVACSSSSSVSMGDAGDAGSLHDAGKDAKPHDGGHVTMNDAGKDVFVSMDAPVAMETGPSPSDASDAGDSSPPAPFLTALSVTSASDTGAIALVPAFSPTTYDYYVRCAAGSNSLSVSMTASTGAESSLSQPTPSASAPMQTVAVSATESQAIVAVATAGSQSTSYWVRCLPHNFPQLSLTTYPEAGAPTPGYYLLGNLQAAVSGGYAMILDTNGVPVWYEAAPTGEGVIDVDEVVSGKVSYLAASTTVLNPFQIDTLSPVSTTTVAPDGYSTDEHELRMLANGHFLVLSYPLTAGVDLTGLTIATADGGTQMLGGHETIEDCAVVEFDSTGTVAWTWLASQHFAPAQDTTLPILGTGPGVAGADGGVVYDVFHCNSIDVDPATQNLLVSAREMDSIFYIDKTTGKVLWKMGGATASLDNAQYITASSPFYKQHDARLQPGWSTGCHNGAGQISLFDDETGEPGPARGVLYDVIVGGNDAGPNCDAGAADEAGALEQATVAWQFPGAVSSAATGSFRISADGSHVIDWGLGGTPGLVFTEVSPTGARLLDFRFTDGNASYRTIKVPVTDFDIGTLRSAVGQ